MDSMPTKGIRSNYFGFLILDIEYTLLDIGYWILVIGYWLFFQFIKISNNEYPISNNQNK
jgi:hypothetical protein